VLDEGMKLRGGYYTPSAIGGFLARWAIRSRNVAVLEPSAGDGQIAAQAAKRLGPGGRLVAIELFPEEAEKISEATPRAEVAVGDVFKWYWREPRDGTFSAVLGNPPFIRYQNFPEDHRRYAFALMEQAGLRPSRLTNAWVPFVVLATRALRSSGRLALVLPAELLQVTYAGELREYLVRKYSDLKIITFRKLVFAGIQQETVLLLGTRADSTGARISFHELDSLDDLDGLELDGDTTVPADLDHGREKWTQYYLSSRELGLIRKIEASEVFSRLGDVADVDVGIVTGRNEFFLLSPAEADARGVRDSCLPLVGRSLQIPGLRLTQSDWRRLAERGDKCLLLQLGEVGREELPPPAARYVRWGERQGHHHGYKCRIRLPRWWNVPSVWSPDAFLLRQIYDGPRIIANEAGVTCTDTIHRVRMTNGMSPGALAAVSMNSLTFAFSEIRGRSYGGGVLELEPTEAEGLPIPKVSPELPLDDLHDLAQTKRTEEVLAEVDRRVLEPVGLTRRETRVLRGIWRKLSERRLRRSKKS
jgi:adenine-specific DNA methylase